jgi:IS1 family transposase
LRFFGVLLGYLAVDRKSKLIIASFAGKRTQENTLSFLGDLKKRTGEHFQLTTDAANIYGGCCGSVSRVFGNSIDYATETKRYMAPMPYVPRRVVGLRRRRRIGNPDLTLATTCHVERTNLSVRQFTRRFTRCTLGFSKKLENLRHAVALFVWHFNFVRVHSAHGKTPAQAVGLTERALTITELFESAI